MHNVVKNLKYKFLDIDDYKYLESNLAKYSSSNESVFSNFTFTYTYMFNEQCI